MHERKDNYNYSLLETLWSDTNEIAVDFLEIGLDEITENALLKEIPVIGTVIRLGKAVVSIRDRYMLKKTLVFVKEVNNGTISKEDLEKHKNKLKSNIKKMNVELENIIILIDRLNGLIKSIILANFYKSYMSSNNQIDWENFCMLSEMLENMSIHDIDTLADICEKNYFYEGESFSRLSISRLGALGLAEYFNGSSVSTRTEKKNFLARSNDVGKDFYNYGIKSSIYAINKLKEDMYI